MMRPEALFSYFRDIESLPGVGKRNRAAFERLCGRRVCDILFHMPYGIIDRSATPLIMDAVPDQVQTLEVRVIEHKQGPTKKVPYRVTVADESGFMDLVFFHPRNDWLQRQLPEGSVRLISGKVEDYRGARQMTHPDYILSPEEADQLPRLEPVYPMTQGLSAKVFAKAMAAALKTINHLPEWQDNALLQREKWPDFLTALNALHHPQKGTAIDIQGHARRRLAYDELLSMQLALALARESVRKKRGRALLGDGSLRAKILDALSFALTLDQEKALADILGDMESQHAMLRLLQGDVGSGKTIVALLAIAAAIEAGGQAALLAPTEILARQHFDTIAKFAETAGFHMAFLSGRVKGKAREQLLGRLEAGEVDLLIGTHALIQDDVLFSDLAFVVIDEQHRFGVEQRLKLARKSKLGVDTLVMTATPIPRTLTLMLYGDLDVSRIREKPPGRQPVETFVISQSRLSDVMSAVGRKIDTGEQVYWVCPLIEESETADLAAAEERYAGLRQIYGDRVALVHGRMKAAEKDHVMAEFQRGNVSILVSTTVIEVGVDVPEATVMVIEQAERFGLSQLHQLRGRVGRGSGRSSCLLVRADHISSIARERLQVMRDSDDGFVIAEEDMRLRGSGEILGTRQSGLPDFRLVDLTAHTDLIEIARDDARRIALTDPKLAGKRGEALRHLLYLFERDSGIRLMHSG